jgi:hypothetical protein
MGARCYPGDVVIVNTFSETVDVHDVDSGAFLSPRAALSLDLTTGPLDFGTRALLALVAPDYPQPLTSPTWERCEVGWRMRVFLDGRTLTVLFHRHAHELHDVDLVGGIWIPSPAVADEKDPRRALSLALHAAWDARGSS